jgi:glycosyltransferase involved in cell wall biosynthesis
MRGGFDIEWWAREADKSDRRETRAHYGLPPDSPVVLFCAKLMPRKRPQDVLRAFARTVATTKCSLIFAGDGPLRAQLEAEAKTLGISEAVVFCGFVNQSRLPALFRAADLFVLSSEWDGGPLVVGEVMSCGCPVVLSDAIPGRLELVRHGETGFVYPCGDVDALASVFREALRDPAQLKKLSASASEFMKTWSIPVYVEGFAKVVADLVASRGADVQAQET